MNKKISSKLLVLAFAVGIFGVVSVANVLGADVDATPTATTTIVNIAPTIATVYDDSDNGASPGDPTNAGSDVTFTSTYNDTNEDSIWLAICQSDAITPHATGGAPTCDGGDWEISASALATDGSGDGTESITYTTLTGDSESNAWWAFVCDDETPSLCSSSSQGSGANDSPFNVNHVPTFELVYVNDTNGTTYSDVAIEPNDTVYFNLKANGVAEGIDDTDTDAAQDTVTVRICVDGTANYAACTGGALICTHAAFNPATTAFTCNSATLASAPYAHNAAEGFEVFIQDNHNFDGTGTAGQDFVITDVDPYISDSGEYAVTDITLAADVSTAKSYTVTVKDDNGDDDLTAVSAALYQTTIHSLASGVCDSADENECYDDSTCVLSAQSGDNSDISATATCDFTVWFNAYDSTTNAWKLHANPSDGGVITTEVDSGVIEVNALTGLSVDMQSGSTIAYGTVALGAVSTSGTAKATDISNVGNQVFDVLLSGTNMNTAPVTQAIAAAQQEWHHETTDFTWGAESAGTSGPYELETGAAAPGADTDGCLDLDMAVRTANDNTALDNAIFWKIKIPLTQPSGSYSGVNTFASTAGSCTGYDGSSPD